MSKLCLLLLGWVAFFSGTTPHVNCVQIISVSDNKCALPGPDNVDVEIAGTSYFYIAWDGIPEASFYRVDVFKYPNGPLMSSRIATAVPGRNGVITDGLQAGFSYNIYVHSGCSNGMVSPKL